MVDFTLSEKDREIIDEIRREGLVKRKYARYYDTHESEMVPEELPEAKAFVHIDKMIAERGEEGTGSNTFGLLTTMHRRWGDFMLLKFPERSLGNASLTFSGTEEQKKQWENTRLAMASTEPGCGSDPKALETTAELDGAEWVLNGEKVFVTHGVRADGVVVWATIDRSAGRAGIKSFVVMKDTPGFEMVAKEKKLGIRSNDTAAFVLKNCRIPRENLVGRNEEVKKKKSGAGYKGMMKTFNLRRPGVAATGIGAVMACMDFVRDEMEKEGVEVDWEVGQHNRTAVQQKMIDLEAEIEAATLITFRAGWLLDNKEDNNRQASIAKLKGGDVSRRGPQLALEILGAAGITHDHLVEKWFRDARPVDIYEGTGEIQRLIVARAILGYSATDLK